MEVHILGSHLGHSFYSVDSLYFHVYTHEHSPLLKDIIQCKKSMQAFRNNTYELREGNQAAH